MQLASWKYGMMSAACAAVAAIVYLIPGTQKSSTPAVTHTSVQKDNKQFAEAKTRAARPQPGSLERVEHEVIVGQKTYDNPFKYSDELRKVREDAAAAEAAKEKEKARNDEVAELRARVKQLEAQTQRRVEVPDAGPSKSQLAPSETKRLPVDEMSILSSLTCTVLAALSAWFAWLQYRLGTRSAEPSPLSPPPSLT